MLVLNNNITETSNATLYYKIQNSYMKNISKLEKCGKSFISTLNLYYICH